MLEFGGDIRVITESVNRLVPTYTQYVYTGTWGSRTVNGKTVAIDRKSILILFSCV